MTETVGVGAELSRACGGLQNTKREMNESLSAQSNSLPFALLLGCQQTSIYSSQDVLGINLSEKTDPVQKKKNCEYSHVVSPNETWRGRNDRLNHIE